MRGRIYRILKKYLLKPVKVAFLEKNTLRLEKDSLQHQLHQLTQSILEHSSVFDENVYRSLNSIFDKGYTEKNELSEKYLTDGGEEFYSCILLQKAVNIDLDNLALCGHAHSGNRGCVRVGKFNGNKFPIDLLLAARLKITQVINRGIDTPCTGCDQLQKRKWGTCTYPLESITINDWTECNLRCEYCYTLDPSSARFTGSKRTHSLPLLFEDIFAQGYIGPNAKVSWGGGEVTIYKDFEVVSRTLIERRIPQLVNTNAVLFSPTIERGLRTKTMTVQVSVDAGTREIYKTIKGSDAFDMVWENIGKYAQAGSVILKYVLYNKNSDLKVVENFVELCQQKHVASIVLCPEARQNIQKTFSDDTLRSAAAILFKAKQIGLPYSVRSFYPQAQMKINEYLQQFAKK
jgi:molybdenum cofactor biosynthesis enzyme MoaA